MFVAGLVCGFAQALSSFQLHISWAQPQRPMHFDVYCQVLYVRTHLQVTCIVGCVSSGSLPCTLCVQVRLEAAQRLLVDMLASCSVLVVS
jgi:hypothetical protein